MVEAAAAAAAAAEVIVAVAAVLVVVSKSSALKIKDAVSLCPRSRSVSRCPALRHEAHRFSSAREIRRSSSSKTLDGRRDRGRTLLLLLPSVFARPGHQKQSVHRFYSRPRPAAEATQWRHTRRREENKAQGSAVGASGRDLRVSVRVSRQAVRMALAVQLAEIAADGVRRTPPRRAPRTFFSPVSFTAHFLFSRVFHCAPVSLPAPSFPFFRRHPILLHPPAQSPFSSTSSSCPPAPPNHILSTTVTCSLLSPRPPAAFPCPLRHALRSFPRNRAGKRILKPFAAQHCMRRRQLRGNHRGGVRRVGMRQRAAAGRQR